MRLLSFLQWAAALSTAVLTLGALIEYWPGLKHVLRISLKLLFLRSKPFERCALKKLVFHSVGPILVVLGIGGELLFETGSFIVENRLTTESDRQVLALRARADTAERETADLLKVVAPRDLTKGQQNAIGLRLEYFSGNPRTVYLRSYPGDGEAARLIILLKHALGTGVVAEDRTGEIAGSETPFFGIRIERSRGEDRLAETLFKALHDDGKLAVEPLSPLGRKCQGFCVNAIGGFGG